MSWLIGVMFYMLCLVRLGLCSVWYSENSCVGECCFGFILLFGIGCFLVGVSSCLVW